MEKRRPEATGSPPLEQRQPKVFTAADACRHLVRERPSLKIERKGLEERPDHPNI